MSDLQVEKKKRKTKKEVPLDETDVQEELKIAPKRKRKSPEVQAATLEINDPIQVESSSSIEEIKPVSKKKRKSKEPQVIVNEPLIKAETQVIELDDQAKEEKEKPRKRKDIVIERFNADIKQGLTVEEAEDRMIANLNNSSDTGSSKTIIGIFITNIVTFFNLLNFAVAAWIIYSGGSVVNLAFMVVSIANITIGIIQEINAKRTIDKLSLLSAPTSFVIRDGVRVEVATDYVVIDDILYLETGKEIASDSVVREGVFEVNESLLTGESDAIIKRKGDALYAGSFVVSGSGYAQVTNIGKENYIQKLTVQAKKYKRPKSDLLRSLKIVIRTVAVFILPAAYILYTVMSKHTDLTEKEIVLKTAGAIIGMIPNGLFLLTSMALAVGVIRLGKRNAYVQELYCIEMLARVDTLCLDKTGTITDGTMTVKSILEYQNKTGIPLKHIISGMLNAEDNKNITSQALEQRFGLSKKIKYTNKIAFSSARKFSAVEFDGKGTFIIGAPEFVIKKEFDKIRDEVDKQSLLGYRVIVIAHTKGSITEEQTFEGDAVPLALVMIEDTIRPDAIETINYFKQYGVDVKVISGDNPKTVSRIAQRAGINHAHQYISLEGMNDKEVERAAENYTVFGRVTPHQKRILIRSLKNQGRTVAMTGDGVNDILALREADTSIAMASGSEAARNVSHLVLLDSNFSSMPLVVSEGRRVINNIQRVSALFLTKTIFSVLLAVMAIVQKGVYPIQPSQLSLIDWFVIGVPSFFLALESNNKQAKGKFLWNVIKTALPGAILVMINSLIVIALKKPLAMDERATSTLITLLATITSLTVLFRVSRPFNSLRRFLFATMVIAAAASALLLPWFFEFTPFWKMDIISEVQPLTLPQILLLIALGQATYPMMYLIANFYGGIKKVIRKTLDKIESIQ